MGAKLHTLLIALLAIASSHSSPTLANKHKLGNNGIGTKQQNNVHRFQYDDGTYEISSERGTWAYAQRACALKGMELVSIESLEEQLAIAAQIGSYSEEFWTSGSDTDTNLDPIRGLENHLTSRESEPSSDRSPYPQHIFYWETTGHALGPFTYWSPGQPDNNEVKYPWNCIALKHDESYGWHDYSCLNSMRYICEKRDKVPDTDVDFSFGGVNYKISSLKLNWWKAKFDCRTKGMRLLSIESDAENKAVQLGVQAFEEIDNFWLSATDLGNDGDLYWDSTGKFLDSSFSDWMQGEPILGVDNRHCAHMSIVTTTNAKQQWKVADCSTRFRYVCESIPQASKFLESTNSTLLEKIQKADHDVVERFTFRNSIYEISHVKVDWYLAKLACKEKGMELLSIETPEEQFAVLDQIENIQDNFWTSANAEGNWDYGFIWDSTGRAIWQYTNWGSREPNNGLSPGNCVALGYEIGFRWYDLGCKNQQLKYICEKKDSFEDEAIKFSYGSNNYEAFSHTYIWRDANRDCRSRGMSLVSMHSQEESNAINFVLSEFSNAFEVWTSAVNFVSADNYYWEYNGSDLYLDPTTNWAPSQPKTDLLYCTTLSKINGEYKWLSDLCYRGRVYICKS